MTHFTKHNLRQKSVFWGNPQPDGSGGFTYADPVELKCRWENVGLVELGNISLTYDVRIEVQLDQDVDEQGMMWLGKLEDVPDAYINDPSALGAHMIVRFDKIPTLKAKYFYRKVYLGRLWTGKV